VNLYDLYPTVTLGYTDTIMHERILLRLQENAGCLLAIGAAAVAAAFIAIKSYLYFEGLTEQLQRLDRQPPAQAHGDSQPTDLLS
jgi:hypothetical protein